GISVVAEGIETAAESAYLKSQTQLRIGQGYLYHRPQLLMSLLDDGAERHVGAPPTPHADARLEDNPRRRNPSPDGRALALLRARGASTHMHRASRVGDSVRPGTRPHR